MIFQEPMTSLNPLHTIEQQIGEVLKIHRGLSNSAAQNARARPARQGRHRGPEGPPRLLPAPALRRPAAARDDRHGARQRARPAHRRRADHGARRDHPGADPRPAAQAQIRVQHGHAADHPRSRHRAQDGRPGLRHDQWRDRRARRDARHLRFAAASLHQASACVRAEGHAACRRSEGADDPRSQGFARVVSRSSAASCGTRSDTSRPSTASTSR